MKDLLQTQSLADSKTVKNLANLSSEQRYKMLETLRQTEAKDWIRRYRKKIKEEGNKRVKFDDLKDHHEEILKLEKMLKGS
jgi:hypothetical protein